MTVTDRIANSLLGSVMPRPAVPRTVALEILWGCNLRCNYCYIGIEHNWQEPIVPNVSEIACIVDKIVDAGVQEIYLVGGEPLAHPQFEEICRYVAQSGVPVRGVCTNGTLLTRKTAQMLRALDFFADVSLRGADPGISDEITGVQGAFERSVKGVLSLSEVGVPVGIEFDCTPHMAPGLYALIDRLVGFGAQISQVFLHRIAPHGDGSKLQAYMALQDYERVFRQAKRIQNDFRITTTFEDGFPLCLTDQSNWDHIVPCECGTYFATVDPKGNVRRCPCHPSMLGNLFVTDLQSIWACDLLEEFRSLSWLVDACKSCTLVAQCRGGCPVSSPDCSLGFAPDVFSDEFVPVLQNLDS